MKDAIAKMTSLSANAYSGTITGSASANLQQTTPQYLINLDAKNINMQTLLEDVLKNAYLSGTGSLTLNLKTKGLTPEQLELQALNGKVSTNINDGQLLNLGFNQSIEQAAKLLRQNVSVSDDFNSLTANADINNGLAQTTLHLDAPNLQGDGDGTINLVKQNIDLDLSLRYLRAEATKELVIPATVSGNFDNIKISIDSKKLLSQTLNQNASKLVDKAKDFGVDLSGLFS